MQKCQLCGDENPPRARYCMSCGQTLGMAARSEEVRRVSVLFADLVSSTALISRSDPEDARSMLDEVVQRLRVAVREFGGTVVRVAGDGILALFGAPVAQEDHARRAALAALRMQADMESAPLVAPDGRPLRIRVGVSTGDVLLRSVASDLHVEYTAEGINTHLAAKLQQAAEPGSVLVTSELARLVQGFVDVRAHAPVVVRGIDEPLAVFELERATGLQSRFQVAVGRGLSPLVGREAELARLEGIAAQAERGRLCVAGVVGEPGVGKSRLLWELGHRLRSRGWRVFSAHSTLDGTAVAFHPVLVLLREIYGMAPGADAQVLRGQLQAGTAGSTVELAPLLALLGGGADLRWDSLDARERQVRTQEALVAALLAAGSERPCALCIHDLHEADAETLALAERLARGPAAGRLLLLLEYRSGQDFGFQRFPAFATVPVEPLAEEEARALFRRLADAHPGLAELEGALVERVAGNPFFLEEGVRMLGSSPLPSKQGRGVPLPIPASVMDVIESRVAQLPPAECELLKLASAVGKDAHLPLLHGLTGTDPGRLQASLARLVEAGFLADVAGASVPAFRHAVIQEVAYRMMLRPERQRIHARILDLLERRPLPELPERITLLARHAVKAEQWDKAVDYLERAAQMALSRASPREAVRLLDEALAALPRLAGQRTTEREIDMQLALRAPLLAVGNLVRIGKALERLEQLMADCVDPVRQGRLAVLIACHRWLSGQHQLAVEAGRRAIALGTRLDDFTLLMPARHYVGAALHELGQFAESEVLLAANVESVPEDAVGEDFGMAGLPAVFCRATRGWLYTHMGRFAEAEDDAREALRIATRAGHAFSILSATFTTTALQLERAQFEAAHALLAPAVVTCERDRQGMWLPALGAMCALVLARLGQIEEARVLLQKVVPRPGDPLLSSFIRLTVAQAEAAIGRPETARDLVQALLARTRALGERVWEAEALALAGEVAERLGDGSAPACRASALELANALGMRALAARCTASQAAA